MELKNTLYYAGLGLKKDLEFCKIFDELKVNKDVKIIRHDRYHLIKEMEYVDSFSLDRIETGKTHIGFEFHFIVFYYKGYVFDVEPASFYPFADENDPGKFNFVCYKKVSKDYEKVTKFQQASYKEKFESIKDIDIYLEKHTPIIIKDTYPREYNIEEREEE